MPAWRQILLSHDRFLSLSGISTFQKGQPVTEQLEKYWLDLIGVGIRPYGSKAIEKARDVMLGNVRAYSPDAFVHEFAEPAWVCGDWSLAFAAPEKGEIPSFLLIGSGAGEFEGELRHIGTNSIWRMYIWERFAVMNGNEIAAYISVRSDGDAIPQTLLEGCCEKPHFVVGRSMLDTFLRCKREKLIVKGYANTSRRPDAKGYNIVAPIAKGAKRVLIMAHYDTVYNSVGAYDNASGTAVVVELGRILSGLKPQCGLEIILMDGEEFCLAGSRAYARDHGEDIDFVINIDGVGREKILEVWAGNEAFEREMMDVLRDHESEFEIIYKWPPAPGSDHAPFYDKGLPVVMLTFNDLGILHTKDDVYERSKLDNMQLMVRLVLEILAAKGIIRLEGGHDNVR